MSHAQLLFWIACPVYSWAQVTAPIDPELVSAGKKDSIKAIDHPKFVTPTEAAKWLHEKEPVIVVELNGEARAYPLQILIWHLLINDRLGETPVLVSYSVFSHSAMVYERRVHDAVYDFGFAGKVRNSDFVMFDRQSDSLWQQISGEAIRGSLMGAKLTPLPGQVVPFEVFSQSYPDGKVLSRDTGFERAYGQNPYARYLADGRLRYPAKLPNPMPLPPMEKLVVVQGKGSSRGYPASVLSPRRVVEDKIGGEKFVIFSDTSMLSASNSPAIADSAKEVAAGVSPVVDGKPLSFRVKAGSFVDRQTGSIWNLLGISTKGPMAGKHLRPVPNTQAFAFAWLAFHPDTPLMTAPGAIFPDMADPLDQTTPNQTTPPVPNRPTPKPTSPPF